MNTKSQILEMVKEGTISVEEGVQLLSALDETKTNVNPTTNLSKKPLTKRMLRVDVDSKDGKVKVNIPLSLAKIGLDISNQLNINGKQLDLKGIDLDEILSRIDDDASGEIVTVDTEDGEKVRVFID